MFRPIPAIIRLADFFLQNLENIHLAHLTEKHKIAGYFRYVDDILLIYDPDHTIIQDITNDFNTLHPNLKFTTKLETNNKLNYLDITIHRTPKGWKISIYRKPNFTDSIIPYSSNHPAQHKHAAIRYLYNRLHTYNLHDHEYRTEENAIHIIMFNNAFPIPPKTTPHLNRITAPQQTENHIYTETGHVHLHRQRDDLYHQLIQKHRSENSNTYQLTPSKKYTCTTNS